MTRTERRLLADTALIGVLLTGIVAALDFGGFLATPEYFFYDQRARHCQFFQPPPTDRLVHLDIDDRALAAVGAWPWPRSRLAEIVDEINLAGTKALDLDIIFPEPQAAGYEEVESGSGFRVPGSGKLPPGPGTRFSALHSPHRPGCRPGGGAAALRPGAGAGNAAT